MDTDALSRASGDVADRIRTDIQSGKVTPGRYLPSERSIAAELDVSGRTVRRALKFLETDGLIRAIPRRGYRVLSSGLNRTEGSTLALIYSGPPTAADDVFYRRLLGELQSAASRRKMALLGVARNGRNANDILEHIRSSGSDGVILDSYDADLIDGLAQAGIPVVMVDSWLPSGRFDFVVQDGFSGGFQAAQWLMSRGHRNFAYFGHWRGAQASNLERLGGAMAALASEDLEIPSAQRMDLPFTSFEELLPHARALFARARRPIGILAPWQDLAHAIMQAAHERRLTPGKDFDVVGWSTEEDYPSLPPGRIARAAIPPMIVWSMARMADVALARLIERRAAPQQPTTATKIPVILRIPAATRRRG